MPTYKYKYIMAIVNYVLEGHNIIQSAKHFCVSRVTIRKYLNAVRKEDGEYYDPILAEKINLALKEFRVEAKSNDSKEKLNLNQEIVYSIVNEMLVNCSSLQDIAQQFECSFDELTDEIKKYVEPIIFQLFTILSALKASGCTKQEIDYRISYLVSQNDFLSQIQNPEMLKMIKRIYNLEDTLLNSEDGEKWTR